MRYKEHLPHSSLQDHVKCFWMLERAYTPEHPTEDVTPDAFVELIFNFGTPYVLQREDGAVREMPKAFLMGLHSKPLVFRSAGTVKLVAARFHAWGAFRFLATPAHTPGTGPMTLGREWSDLADTVEPHVLADDYDGAIALVEDCLIGKLLMATVDVKEIQTAARMLHAQRGHFRVTELAEQCNVSTRQLQRRFQDVVGVSPKALARAIRFEEIRKRLMFDPDTSLTELAYEFGYSDQPHFIHDFKEFADKTPGEFADEMRWLQATFRDQDNVVFLQVPPSRPA